MERKRNTLILSIMASMLLIFSALLILDTASDHIHSQMIDQVEVEAVSDLELDNDHALLPIILGAVLDIIADAHHVQACYQTNGLYCLNNPPSPPKVHRTILFHSLKIPNS